MYIKSVRALWSLNETHAYHEADVRARSGPERGMNFGYSNVFPFTACTQDVCKVSIFTSISSSFLL
jgi:hypothetical protein